MKTPETFLLKYSPAPHAGYKNSWVIKAMKEYAKQWADQTAKKMDLNTGYGSMSTDYVLGELKKQIDAQ